MFYKNNFFKDFNFKSKKFSQNIKKTKKVFSEFEYDLKNYNISTLESYKKEYEFDFSFNLIKKFNKYKEVVLVGMGGSILGTKSIYSFLKNKIKKKIYFFDNLDDNLYLNQIKSFKNPCFVVVSKSGDTLETIVNTGVLYSKKKLRNKLIIITEINDGVLSNIANKLNADIVEHKNFISGRYSVLSESGMLPAALMGLNIKKFKNLNILMKNKKFISSLIHNVAYIYTLNKQRINNSVILNYDSNLNDLSLWYQQLVSESLGKKGKGINLILSNAPKDHHSVLQLYLDGPKDKFFTFFESASKKSNYKVAHQIIPNSMKFLKNKNINSIIKAQSDAVKKIFLKDQIPFRQFLFNKKNEEELGKIFTFFVLETILLARLMKINPFDQPAVEKVKVETKKILLK